MKSPSTVRSRATGISRRGLRTVVLVGVAALPVLSMGLTVPSAVSVREGRSARMASLARLERRNELVRRLGEYADVETLEAMRGVHSELRSLIPTGVRALDEFGHVREACSALGISIREIRRARTHATALAGAAGAGSSAAVVIDEVIVTFTDTRDTALALVDDLRSNGHPLVVLGFDFSRSGVTQTRFQTELRLGFLRRTSNRRAPEGQEMQIR